MPTYGDFEKLGILAGKIERVEDFPEANKPAYKLWIDFGDAGVKKSSAQITKLYNKEDLIGRMVVAVTGFPPKQIANFVSEVLVLGILDSDNNVVLLKLDSENGIEPGAKIC
ncbi:MAG: tRNA-binding protein [Candidatus Aenigmarchaeota archaeon]|nr:tRNA-binding protein [Candidatus Aenigmarchaeota archaeon]